ncbi:MAG: TatD family hydrolase [Bacilli bacterium]|nr:TatD family hydrolase [Bacilli bacterium]
MYIDTHCHLQSKYYENIDAVIKDNRKAGIDKIIVSGCEICEIKEVIEYAKKYDDVYLTLGFHPEYADSINDIDISWLKEVVKNNNKVIGIGEIGLDYYYSKENRDRQINLFRKMLELASELNLPVVIHSRNATLDTINILKEYNVVGVIHCFSGSLETANEYIKMGYYLGIGGVVTFKNSNLRDILKELSLDNIVLETDSPYLTPTPFRGKINSSKNIPLIAEELSNIFSVTCEEVSIRTINNTKSIFNI